MFEILAKQFEKPEKILGRLAGKIMYFKSRKINKWTVGKHTLFPYIICFQKQKPEP